MFSILIFQLCFCDFLVGVEIVINSCDSTALFSLSSCFLHPWTRHFISVGFVLLYIICIIRCCLIHACHFLLLIFIIYYIDIKISEYRSSMCLEKDVLSITALGMEHLVHNCDADWKAMSSLFVVFCLCHCCTFHVWGIVMLSRISA